MTNKRAMQAFLTTSTLFLVASGMNARTRGTGAPVASAQTPVAATASAAPQSDARAGKPDYHGGFKTIDTNGDDQVSRDEAKGRAWLKEDSGQIGTNHDGQPSKDELAAWHKVHKGEIHEKMAQRFDAKFKAADKDNDDSLTEDEVWAGMPHLAKNFGRIDTNYNGEITGDKTRVYMKARHDARKAQRNTPAAAVMLGGPSVTEGE